MKLIDMTPEQREVAQAFYRTRYAAEKKYQAAYREQNREKECARVAAWRARKAEERRSATPPVAPADPTTLNLNT
jgi:hypothetical protein